ncbi:MAG: type III-A CRISPR-associated protein Cas10/Csm1 [Anaerolineae bacterium]
MDRTEIGTNLILYALKKFARRATVEVDLPEEPYWTEYERYLSLGQWGEPEAALSCIFSRVQGDGTPPKAYLAAQPLTLKRETLFPGMISEAPTGIDWPTLWNKFHSEYEALQRYIQQHDPRLFDAFCHLFYRWAWSLPCDYGEPGISLYEQWKAVAALYFASRGSEQPAPEFTLVGGDIPGIQDFVYTITSKGAAKGLRGRSLFIQLLGDAIVRRLLIELDLSLANVIYNAGGNFLLLAARDAPPIVDNIRLQANRRFIEALQGGAALILEHMPVRIEELFTPGLFTKARGRFAQQVAQAKNQPLRELALTQEGWQKVFTCKDKGSELSCAVCHVEVDLNNNQPLERTGEISEVMEAPRICNLCHSFAQLAHDIAPQKLWLTIEPQPDLRDTEASPSDHYQTLLSRISGLKYQFENQLPQNLATALAINEPAFLDFPACGFRLLANVTPTVTEQDRQYLRKEKVPEDQWPEVGDVRSFTLLAYAAKEAGAIERVGVLRMDVDGLGAAFEDGMPDMTMPALSSMSAALERFFNGYLNVMIQEKAQNDLYIIYSGGDDLFIVGAWHHLPDLAETIHEEFKAFTGNHPRLSLSGGITLEGARFPLYRAAERAGAAERRAKSYTRNGRRKDALCFLDTVVGWEDWHLVRSQKDELLSLLGGSEKRQNAQQVSDKALEQETKAQGIAHKAGREEKQRLPRRLLQLLQNVHQLYRSDLALAARKARQSGRKPPDARLFFGRWMWAQIYYLNRLAEQSKDDMPDVPERIRKLQETILTPEKVRYTGLVARWAEYLTRGKESQQK